MDILKPQTTVTSEAEVESRGYCLLDETVRLFETGKSPRLRDFQDYPLPHGALEIEYDCDNCTAWCGYLAVKSEGKIVAQSLYGSRLSDCSAR